MNLRERGVFEAGLVVKIPIASFCRLEREVEFFSLMPELCLCNLKCTRLQVTRSCVCTDRRTPELTSGFGLEVRLDEAEKAERMHFWRRRSRVLLFTPDDQPLSIADCG